MAKALHTPFRAEDGQRVGPNLYRKQVLPVGTIDYRGQQLDFTKERNDEIARNFAEGAFDQVPFTLVNESNEHTDDPERFRGEVKALDSEADGLYATVELTDDGAKIVSDNPKLGLSARIRPDFEKAGKKLGTVIQHVAGTLDPRGKGMKPWEAVELSDNSPEVVDLTDGEYSETVKGEENKGDGLTDEERTKLRELLERVKSNGEGGEEANLSDDDAQRILDGLLSDSKTEPQTVELSEEQRKVIDLAEQKAKDAERRVGEVEQRLATERWERQRDELVKAGVPPAVVNLAEPVLKRNAAVIDLSDNEKLDAQEVVRKVLDEFKGTIDFAEVGGSSPTSDESQEAREKAEAWAKHERGEV